MKYISLSGTMISQGLYRQGPQFKSMSDQMKEAVKTSEEHSNEAAEATKFQQAAKQATHQTETLSAASRIAIYGMQFGLVPIHISATILILDI